MVFSLRPAAGECSRPMDDNHQRQSRLRRSLKTVTSKMSTGASKVCTSHVRKPFFIYSNNESYALRFPFPSEKGERHSHQDRLKPRQPRKVLTVGLEADLGLLVEAGLEPALLDV